VEFWTGLLDVLILVLGALVLGALFERLRLSAVVGYLLAGTLLGPNALDWLPNHEAVSSIAELGIALLLFTIGLEFSWRRLRRMGAIALGGGSLQVLLTGALAAGVCRAVGLNWPSSLALGAIIALSSTAAVLRLLTSRAEMDSGVHGRNALGILLVQDISVVPLAFFVAALGRGVFIPEIGWEEARVFGLAMAFVGLSYAVLRYVVPVFLRTEEAARNRDLAILLAIATVIGASWGSHALGLSPALGAFVAGVLLAESPFAVQLRADVAALRILFMTLFFSSIGTQADPTWALENWKLVGGIIAAIVIGKSIVTTGATLPFHSSPGHAVATGLCLAQVGEFSFVLAEVAQHEGVINGELLTLIVTATIGTLFLTPFLVAIAPRVALVVGRLWGSTVRDTQHPEPSTVSTGHVVIVGFGPAGQGVAEALIREGVILAVVELNSKTAAVARSNGLQTYVGDARSEEVLESLHLEAARAVVVTVPDPKTTRQIIERVRARAPGTTIVARARYHVCRWELQLAGAHEVVDEEDEVGLRIASKVRETLLDVEGGP
jgi:CPA2 family monovalent cation:H+ antiporter-2